MYNNKLIYIPALSVGALSAAMKNNLKFADNTSMRYYHTDFIDEIRYPYFLITGGHYYKKPNISNDMGLFDNKDEFIFGDSGGFQVATGAVKYTEDLKVQIFNWLENNSTIAANLDIPPFGVYAFKEALEISLLNFEYFNKYQTGKTKYLNVLQGKDMDELKTWYNEVKDFKFSGWAVNVKGNSFEKILSAISILMENKEFNATELRYIHFFGTSKIDDIILINEMQKLFNNIGFNVQITIDSSSPNSSRFGSYYYGYDLKKNIFNTLHYPKPNTESGYFTTEFEKCENVFLVNPKNRFDKYINNLYSIKDFEDWNTIINSLVTLHNMYEIIELVDDIWKLSNYPQYIKQQFFSNNVIIISELMTRILTNNLPTSEFIKNQHLISELSRNAPESTSFKSNNIF